MTRLTIRTRVAIWYGAVIVGVLLIVALAISIVYEHIGLQRVDGEIEDAARTLDGVLVNELREEATLPRAAEGALHELDLPGTGVADHRDRWDPSRPAGLWRSGRAGRRYQP